MTRITETSIEADPRLPVILMTRDFAATPEQLFRAHTDPALFAQWVGPDGMQTRMGTRLRTQSLVDSFEARDAWLASGMESGVREGYAKLDRMLDDGAV